MPNSTLSRPPTSPSQTAMRMAVPSTSNKSLNHGRANETTSKSTNFSNQERWFILMSIFAARDIHKPSPNGRLSMVTIEQYKECLRIMNDNKHIISIGREPSRNCVASIWQQWLKSKTVERKGRPVKIIPRKVIETLLRRGWDSRKIVGTMRRPDGSLPVHWATVSSIAKKLDIGSDKDTEIPDQDDPIGMDLVEDDEDDDEDSISKVNGDHTAQGSDIWYGRVLNKIAKDRELVRRLMDAYGYE